METRTIPRISKKKARETPISRNTLYVSDPEKLHRLAQTLSSPIRLSILYYVKQHGEISIKELARLLDISPPIVSRHVRKLEEQGLLVSGIRIGRRGLLKVLKNRYERIVIEL